MEKIAGRRGEEGRRGILPDRAGGQPIPIDRDGQTVPGKLPQDTAKDLIICGDEQSWCGAAMDDYSTRLSATKQSYPFARWANSGLEQYTDQVCASFTTIFDRLIEKLAALSEQAPESEKIEAF